MTISKFDGNSQQCKDGGIMGGGLLSLLVAPISLLEKSWLLPLLKGQISWACPFNVCSNHGHDFIAVIIPAHNRGLADKVNCYWHSPSPSSLYSTYWIYLGLLLTIIMINIYLSRTCISLWNWWPLTDVGTSGACQYWPAPPLAAHFILNQANSK